jgi:hypothetical protein
MASIIRTSCGDGPRRISSSKIQTRRAGDAVWRRDSGDPRRAVASALLRSVVVICALAVSGLPGALAGVRDRCSDELASRIPTRPLAAPTGSAFVQATAGLGALALDEAISAELLSGNMPDFLRHLEPVTLRGDTPSGQSQVTICVLPDYLALGTDDDFLRVPMGLPTAVTVAERFGFLLPTPRMVDAIYAQSADRLEPEPLPPSGAMRTNAYLWRHDRLIRAQRLGHGTPLGKLLAGQKKDLVITNRLRQTPDRIAIYGWHMPGGHPIQPLSTVHDASYADYSHGVRLVSDFAWVDGRPSRLADVLEDSELAPLVSDEGPIRRLAALLGILASHRQLTAVCRYRSDLPQKCRLKLPQAHG